MSTIVRNDSPSGAGVAAGAGAVSQPEPGALSGAAPAPGSPAAAASPAEVPSTGAPVLEAACPQHGPSPAAMSRPAGGTAHADAPRARGSSWFGRVFTRLEVPLLLAVPAAMIAAALSGIAQTALFMVLVVVLVLVLFFAGYEASRPALRQIMPTIVLAALAAAGRVLFAAVPDFKPVSAIAIIAGATLGRRNGFIVGALAALTSNFFFGQGLWTPWQMYAWGVVGYVGGMLADAGAFEDARGNTRTWALIGCGFASGLLYGVIINTYDVIGFVQPLTVVGALARVAAAVPYDVVHGVATAIFLVFLYKPWTRRIRRVVQKYALRS